MKLIMNFLLKWTLFCLAFNLLTSEFLLARQITYQYDSTNRLIHVDYADGASITYTYDNAGNRLIKDQTAATSGAITGTILNSDGSAPIIGEPSLGVIVYSGDPCAQWDTWVNIANVSLEPTDGSYEIVDLQPGEYFLMANTFGTNYILEWYDSPNSTSNCLEVDTIEVVSGITATGKNFQLAQGGVIEGFVFEEDGVTPISDELSIRVDAYSGNPCDHFFIGGSELGKTDGSYATNFLPAGNVYLKINHAQFHPNSWWSETGIVDNCAQASPITLAPATIISFKNFSLVMTSDDDGIDDNWELKWFSNLITANQFTDFDNDGYSDLQEYLNNLANEMDPKNNPYNPTVKNAPGGTGYPPGSFWIMMTPVITNTK